MLALYDRTTEAPEELKYFDLLYQPRGKPPVALITFDDDMVRWSLFSFSIIIVLDSMFQNGGRVFIVLTFKNVFLS